MSKHRFTAFGRDVQAAADYLGTDEGQAVKAVAQWFAHGDFSDSEWNVSVEKDDNGCSVTFKRGKARHENEAFPSVFEPNWDAYASQERAAGVDDDAA